MTAFDLRPNERAIITKINVEGSARERFTSLGVEIGSQIILLGFSLFSASVLLACGAIRLAMRKSLAKRIEVTPCKSF